MTPPYCCSAFMMALTGVETESESTLMLGSKRNFAPSRKMAPDTEPSVFVAEDWCPTWLLFMLPGTTMLRACCRQVEQSSSPGMISPARPVMLAAVVPGVPLLVVRLPLKIPPTLVLVGWPELLTYSFQKS